MFPTQCCPPAAHLREKLAHPWRGSCQSNSNQLDWFVEQLSSARVSAEFRRAGDQRKVPFGLSSGRSVSKEPHEAVLIVVEESEFRSLFWFWTLHAVRTLIKGQNHGSWLGLKVSLGFQTVERTLVWSWCRSRPRTHKRCRCRRLLMHEWISTRPRVTVAPIHRANGFTSLTPLQSSFAPKLPT